MAACRDAGGGTLKTIPYQPNVFAFFYNKDLFEQAGITEEPKTWDEFLDVCEKIKASGVTPIALGNQYSWVVCHYITTLNGKLFRRIQFRATTVLKIQILQMPDMRKPWI